MVEICNNQLKKELRRYMISEVSLLMLCSMELQMLAILEWGNHNSMQVLFLHA